MEGKEGKESYDTSSIHVVEHENARDKPVSYFPKEVVQICKDISSYFQSIAEISLAPPAGKQHGTCNTVAHESTTVSDECLKDDYEIAKINDKVPEALVELLMTHNGSLWILDYETLTVSEILNELEFIEKTAWIPFARNACGDWLVVGRDDHTGKVYECDCVEDGQLKAMLGSCLGLSLATYLESYRDKLLSRQVEFVDGCGIVECSGNVEQQQQDRVEQTRSNKK